MIRSMTAYAKAEKSDLNLVVEFEIRTYNHRHLDISLRVPHGYAALEEKIKSVVSEKLTRGRVDIKTFIRDESEGAVGYEIDERKATALAAALETLKSTLGITGELPMELFTSNSAGIIKPAVVEIDMDAQWPVIKECLTSALDQLVAMREREGAFLLGDFKSRLNHIESQVKLMEGGAEGLAARYKERLVERITKLTEGVVELDEGRIAQEAAFLADRSDISEEIVRAESHIQQFREILDAGGPAGGKLNFLLQEFNREFNTMGSKVGNAELAHVVVGLKSELEKLREQVQNIE